jgi:hypothetical protein
VGVRFVLRWFHAVTWVLMAAWVWTARPGFGLAALVSYLIFLATWFSARKATDPRQTP